MGNSDDATIIGGSGQSEYLMVEASAARNHPLELVQLGCTWLVAANSISLSSMVTMRCNNLSVKRHSSLVTAYAFAIIACELLSL